MLVAGAGVTALGAVIVGGAVVGAGVGGFAWLIAQAGRAIVHGRPQTVVARIRTESEGLVLVRRRHLAETSVSRADDGSLAIDLRFKNGRARFTGRETPYAGQPFLSFLSTPRTNLEAHIEGLLQLIGNRRSLIVI